MLKRYVLLDIETPNTRGNSICALATVLVENDRIVDKKYSLINPEDRFDAIHSKITGIDNEQVQSAPNLKEYWKEVQEWLKDTIIIGHNVAYHLSVLSRALKRYDIEPDRFRYTCTLELSRKYIKAESHKLKNLVAALGYEHIEQVALDDALAAGVLFKYIKTKNTLAEEEIHTYSFIENNIDIISERLVANLHSLSGIIQGILYEDEISQAKIKRLRKWVEDNLQYKRYALFAKIIDTLNVVLEDNVVDNYDKMKLRCLVTKYNSSKLYSETTLGMQILQGILEGITCDDEISERKILKLKEWMAEHDYLTGVYPYDKLVSIVHDVIEDGVIDKREKETLLETIAELADPMSAHNNMGNDFSLKDKTFCLTGEFLSVSKEEFAKKLKEKGAIEKKVVSTKLDYLFVGGLGSNAWKFGKMGGDIARALELQEKGAKVQIVAESDMERALL